MSTVTKDLGNGRQLVTETTDDQILTAVEKVRGQLTDDPSQFPRLTAAHLMGGAVTTPNKNTGVALNIDDILSRPARAMFVGAFMFKWLRDSNPILLHEVYLLQRRGFVILMKEIERADSLAAGLTDKEYEIAWETFERNVQILAAAGAAFRKRKDWRG